MSNQEKNRVAIDLTWIRHGKVGGTESCVRNLLDGMMNCPTLDIQIYLLVAKDNIETFRKYENIEWFTLYECNTIAASQRKRVLWQNFCMGKLLRKLGINVCLEPIYGKPFLGTRGISFITTIHDLQAYHYPEYFSRARVMWMKLSWWNAVHTSKYVIAISNYVKNDILSKYHVSEDKIKVIYDAVVLDCDNCNDSSELAKYQVESKKYYYTVSSLLPHKNLKTLILALGLLKKENSGVFCPLVVSGVGGKSKDELEKLIKENDLVNDVIFTPFVDDAERNMLYKNCKAFLFPSIFEGFGMPPIEAMAMGVPVLTTKCTSLEEVTGGLLNYVSDARSPRMWQTNLSNGLTACSQIEAKQLLRLYKKEDIALRYYLLFV